ncbi:MAG: hypothetical protein IT379_31650 [Deltaproteobacteria bacterium]|nr:hypothetical protein [Deltaproteobacteria bacterium]
MSEIQQEVEGNLEAFGTLLEVLERKNMLMWSDRTRLGRTGDIKGLFDILEKQRVLSWSDAVGVKTYESLLTMLERRHVITWSDRARLAFQPTQQQGRRR